MDDLTPAKQVRRRESEYKRGMSPTLAKGLFLLGGVGVGAAIVLFTLSMAAPSIPTPKVVVREVPGPSQPVSTKPKEEESETKAPAVTTDNIEIKPDGAKGVGTGSAEAFNPFGGSIASLPAKDISGSLPRGTAAGPPSTQTSPTAPKLVTPSPQADPPDNLLVIVRLDVGSGEGALSSLRGIASKHKGAAIQFDESASGDDPQGAVIVVPASEAAKVEADLNAAGSVSGLDHWNGSSVARAGRVEGNALDRISDLHLKKQQLQEKYFDDAPQIVQIDEEVSRIEASLSRFRAQRPGSKMAVFKISFVS